MNRIFVLAFLLLVAALLFGCDYSPPQKGIGTQSSQPVSFCISKCLAAANSGVDFNNGPCLGSTLPDWVCDVVHSPRASVDDLPKNQCADYISGRAHHFVEVDGNCALIKAN